MEHHSKNIFFIPVFIFLSILTMLSPPQVAAQEGRTVNAVDISGNRRVETNTIKSFLGIKKGDSVDASDINNSLTKIFSTGLFADVNIDLKENTLVVRVVENPIIGEVAFEGNKRINNDSLRSEVRLTPRAVYNKTDMQHDVKRILNLYQKSGRFSAVVTPKVIQLEQNRVNLVFEIDEGDKSKIAKISFVGNEVFNDSRLLTTIQTKESRWYRFLSSDDTYDPDRLAFDKELLRRLYVSRGYADFKVLSATAELTPEKEDFFITFTVDEGQKYTFGTMNAESKLPDLDGTSLASILQTVEGQVFNAKLIEKTIEKITKHLGNLGYAFVNIEPQMNRDVENATIGINYLVKEGPRVYVERISINGNVRTLDEVIRREFRLAEGDPFNSEKIKRSQQRIQNLGFFSNLDINNNRGSAPDKAIINVDVEEKSTGELTFGAGFSTTDGALGDVSISERNLLGKGQFLKLNFTIASVRQQIDLSFTEPYFMNKDIAAGFDLFKTQTNSASAQSNRTFDNDAMGAVIRAAYSITEHLRHSVRYSLRSDDISGVRSNASEFIKRQEGKNTTSLIGHSLSWDHRDNKFTPTDGYFVKFNQDLAGFGGDSKFFRNEIKGGYFTNVIGKDFIVKFIGKAGYIFGFGGEDVRINDRFFIGGNDIRGFASDGIGPRDSTSRGPLGGNIYTASTLEMTFPLGLPEELGFSGAVFTDIGTLFQTDDKTTVNSNGIISTVLDESTPRASIGIGIGWKSPLGPIRVDFAKPYLSENFDRTEEVRFSFGTRF